MDNTNTLGRLKKIDGQVKGVIRMVEEGKYCIDIVNQIAAVRGALDKVSMQILQNHINSCVTSAIKHGEQDEIIEELMNTIGRYIK